MAAGTDDPGGGPTGNRRWVDRYAAVESLAAVRGLALVDLDAAAKDLLWNEVKAR